LGVYTHFLREREFRARIDCIFSISGSTDAVGELDDNDVAGTFGTD
jgi:hypothetical protein